MFFFEARIANRMISINTNIPSRQVGDGLVHYYIEEQVEDILIDLKNMYKASGIFVKETEEHFEIYNDPYCKIPIFIYKGKNGIHLASNFDKLIEYPVNIDIIGFYETLYFESALNDRTLFKEIKQLPSASYIKINKGSLEFEILNYWNFDIIENDNIKTEDEAVEIVWNALCKSFKRYTNKNLLMGISGGLDSRLSLCVLKNVTKLDRIDTFTFGYNEKILDYSLATEVCRQIGMKECPRFFKLDETSYLDSMSLPKKSGYGVGINHSHAYWCLQHIDTSDKILISNYYSDAIMGYDCIDIEYEDTIENCDYYKKVEENKWNLTEDIKKEIIIDIRKITDRRSKNANFSCYNEFIYLVERNPKFHIRLTYMFSEFIDTAMPYAEFEMLKTMISLPMEYRYRKKIEHLILAEKFLDIRDVSSTRYSAFDNTKQSIFKKLYYDIGYIRMRMLNLVNSAFNMMLKGRIYIPNKYITENHLLIMNRYFKEYKRKACLDLYKLGILTKEQKGLIDKECRRTSDAQTAFIIIGLWTILKFDY